MRRLSPLGAAIALALCGCSDPAPQVSAPATNPLGPESVATIDSRPVALSLLEQLSLAAAQREISSLTPEQRAQLIDQLVAMQLLADAAVDENLHLDRSLAAELELQRMQLLARAATEAFRSNNQPSEAELRAAYEENLPRYLATQHKARHILVDTEAEAVAIIDELDGGADFATLAMEHSTGPTGPRGGDLGWFTADSMVAPFAEAVRAAEVGVHTPAPVQTRFGWHVILVEDVREQQAPGVEAVRDELVSIVERQKLEGYVRSLRTRATVTTQVD